MTATKLGRHFDRRQRKLATALVAELDPAEREVLGSTVRGFNLWGRPGDDVVVTTAIVRLTPKTKSPRTDMFRREDLAPVVTRLHRLGWLRWNPREGRDTGNFCLTDTAEAVFDSAGVSGKDLWRFPAETA